MDNIDKLIKELQEAKEELNKTTNQSYAGTSNQTGSQPVMQSEEPSPEQEDKKMRAVAQKTEDMGDGRATIGAPSPSAKTADKQMRALATKSEDDVLKCGEYFSLFKNGQWSLDKSAELGDAVARHHTKKFNKLNRHYPKPTGQPNDALADDFRESEAHYAKTGKPIKFPKATQMGKGEDVDKADEAKTSPKASPKGLPYASKEKC